MKEQTAHHKWTEVIEAKGSWLDLHLQHIWYYRDLLVMFVRRDFIATYKQTILGPLWFFIQPLLTTLVFTVVFGKFAGVSTDNQPKLLFFLSGVTIWNYFADSFTKTATVFKDNAALFGKVYFPRLIIPLAIITAGLVRFVIQFLLFLGFVFYFMWKEPVVQPNIYILLTPLLVLMMGGFALGAGMIISSFTTKYRDLTFLLTFGVQLLMYTVPVVYSVNSPRMLEYRRFVDINPLTGIIETFRHAFLGSGTFSWSPLIYSGCWMMALLIIGTIIFNRVEKTFMDTV